MGTYNMFINRDKQEFVDPHRCGDGAKWGEFNWPGSKTMIVVADLFQSGRWSSDDSIRIINDEDDYGDVYYDIILSSDGWNQGDWIQEDWQKAHDEAIEKVGVWVMLSRVPDEEWDASKEEAVSSIAERYGWYDEDY